MEDYISVKTLIENCNKALECLIGKAPTKEPGGLSQMTKSVLEPVLNDASALLEISECRIKVFLSSFDSEIEFANIKPTYKADKRRWDGIGDKLESLQVVLTRDIPEDLYVIDLSQQISYDYAKENFDRLQREQEELKQQYNDNLKSMKELQSIMKYDAYNDSKKKEAEQAMETIFDLGK